MAERIRRLICSLLLLLAGAASIAAESAEPQRAILSYEDRFHPVSASQGMVSSQEAVATGIGVDILKQGGNAVDAAVAVGFALAVTLPRAGNLGGGGFMIAHLADEQLTVAIDYRETAPQAATKNLFLDASGEVNNQLARFSYRSVGVPGTVAGLSLALEKYGTMSLKEIVAPAYKLANDGITVTPGLADDLSTRRKRLIKHSATQKIFFKSNGANYVAGETLKQKDLAWSLKRIAKKGPKAFYNGAIGKKIAAAMEKHNGLITRADLANYRAIVRKPIHGTYRGYDIYSMPPPSSGGVHLVQILNVLEGFPMKFLGANSADSIHIMAEAMKLAYADRATHLGDPDHWPVPVQGLTAKPYADYLRTTISVSKARDAEDIEPGKPERYESNETTHFSVMDAKGNVVSNTYTINFSFGTGIVADGTGIFLNNEMDDFSAKPGVPNAYGLVGGEANAIGPAKRPLSSMTPTIVLKDNAPFLATGSPGGSRIITTTLQIIMNVIDHGMNIAEATAAPRIHHQWLPDELRVERGLSVDTIDGLRARGHKVVTKNAMGSTQSIMRLDGQLLGASDPRRPGALTLGY